MLRLLSIFLLFAVLVAVVDDVGGAKFDFSSIAKFDLSSIKSMFGRSVKQKIITSFDDYEKFKAKLKTDKNDVRYSAVIVNLENHPELMNEMKLFADHDSIETIRFDYGEDSVTLYPMSRKVDATINTLHHFACLPIDYKSYAIRVRLADMDTFVRLPEDDFSQIFMWTLAEEISIITENENIAYRLSQWADRLKSLPNLRTLESNYKGSYRLLQARHYFIKQDTLENVIFRCLTFDGKSVEELESIEKIQQAEGYKVERDLYSVTVTRPRREQIKVKL